MLKQATREEGRFKVLTFGCGDSEDFSLKGCDIVAKAVVELQDSSYCLVFVGTPISSKNVTPSEDTMTNRLKYFLVICLPQRTFCRLRADA